MKCHLKRWNCILLLFLAFACNYIIVPIRWYISLIMHALILRSSTSVHTPFTVLWPGKLKKPSTLITMFELRHSSQYHVIERKLWGFMNSLNLFIIISFFKQYLQYFYIVYIYVFCQLIWSPQGMWSLVDQQLLPRVQMMCYVSCRDDSVLNMSI